MTDPSAYLALWHRVWPSRPRALDELERDLTKLEEPLRPRLWVVENGFAEAQRSISSPGVWWIEIGVLPEARGQGVGRNLFETVRAHIGDAGELLTRVSEDDPSSRQFAERRGFSERKRDFESTLDLNRIDRELLQSWSESPVEIAPMTTVDSPSFRRQFHDLFEIVRQDVPRATPVQPLAFEFFDTIVLSDPAYRWDGSLVALSEGEPIGFSGMFDGPEDRTLDQWLTAVRSDWRRQGIARALKARGILWAAEKGFQSIRTDNDSRNEAMLAINERLGFVRHAALITMAL